MSSADPFRDPAQARQIARLARLALDEPALERLGRELGAILGYVEQLSAVDTSDVLAVGLTAEAPRFREPGLRLDLEPSEKLQNAPDQAQGAFRVPRVL